MFAEKEGSDSDIVFTAGVEEITTAPGETFQLPLNLTNTVSPWTFQFEIQNSDDFNSKFEVVLNHLYDEDDEMYYDAYAVDFGKRITSAYGVSADYNKETTNFKVIVKNVDKIKPMKQSEGLFCTITFKVADDVADGTYDLNVIDAVFNWNDAETDEITVYKPAPFTVKIKVDNSGIEDLKVDALDGETQIYDLMGRRVVNPSQGIYIVNGRKMIMK